MTCRRICKLLSLTVYSIDYRLMPQFSADDALSDAVHAFRAISLEKGKRKLVVMGSSSGGQLAAQVSQLENGNGIDGVLLRSPVTCDAANLPLRWKGKHKSMSTAFHTSLLSSAALTAENRTKEMLPLEREVEELKGMPRHWVQVCTNDIYYSDGACYAEDLEEAGVELRVDVVRGWPHTFWLKAPLLKKAVKVDEDMIEGLRWLLKG
ncbi:hypothetical protein G7Y89_g7197 [Cudoniella acicularis]|uniref:Alpha/beta hydrolase fold-3 domain-containing protein n=1 Tax=Cudoniella acicularis TaxID=354080 RepID=A0A8H4RJT7_9HELO|nr:hypothetical protein G7Y89_g7197 [Cudoniella acicularis]